MANVNPCVKECPERSPICHSLCTRYKIFRAGLDASKRPPDEAKRFLAGGAARNWNKITRDYDKRGRKRY